MNNKYCAYSVYMIFLIINSTIFPMHKTIKYVGIGTLPCVGAMNAYERHNDIKVTKQIVQKHEPVKGKACLFAENIMKKCNAPLIPFKYGNQRWSVVSDHVLQADPSTIHELNVILEKKPNDRSDRENRQLAANAMIIKHEIHHFLNQDSKNKTFADFLIPVAIQTMASTTKYGFDNAIKSQNFKTLATPWMKSSGTTATIIPKLIAYNLAFISYERYLEKNADEFAYKHAESRLELEEYINFWKNHEKIILNSSGFSDIKHDPALVAFKFFLSEDPHPYSGKRAAMGEKYLAQWDEKHADKIQ